MPAHESVNPQQFPRSTVGPLYHGTNVESAEGIEREGFTKSKDYEGVHFATKNVDLAQRYAENRVKHFGGDPAVLAFDVEGVSAIHTGYGHWSRNQEAGADYQDEGAQTVVLNAKAVRNLRRHS